MLWGHAFAEVYFGGWGVSKTDNEKHEPNKAEHQQQANVGRAASCSLDVHVNSNGLDVYFHSLWKIHRDWNSDFPFIEAMPGRIPRLANANTLLPIVTNKRNTENLWYFVYQVSEVSVLEPLTNSLGWRKVVSSASLPAGSWSPASQLGCHLLTIWSPDCSSWPCWCHTTHRLQW